MADLQPIGDVVELTRNEIAAAVGNDPKAIRAFEAIQRLALRVNPNNTAGANETAEKGVEDAASAQGTADDALWDASVAQASAEDAHDRADEAYELAEGRVAKSAGPAWSPATGTASRAGYAAYAGQTISNPPTQAEVQAIDDAVKAMSQAMVAIITDLRSNEALTP